LFPCRRFASDTTGNQRERSGFLTRDRQIFCKFRATARCAGLRESFRAAQSRRACGIVCRTALRHRESIKCDQIQCGRRLARLGAFVVLRRRRRQNPPWRVVRRGLIV
jgi:hypothetical protein